MSIDRVEFDFSTYSETPKSAHLPEGDYLVKVTDAQVTKIKQGQNEGVPGILLTFTVVGGEFAGQVVVDRIWNLSTTLWRSAAFLRAIGFQVAKNKLNPPISAYIGKTLTIGVKDGESFKGEIKSEVSSFKVAKGGAATQAASSTEPSGEWNYPPAVEEPEIPQDAAPSTLKRGVAVSIDAIDEDNTVDEWSLTDVTL